MLFNAGAVLENRAGEPFREPKPGEKPKIHPVTGAPHFDDDQFKNLRYGDIALNALDNAVEGDEKLLKESADKWVKAIMKREAISARISAALKGDGWVNLKEEQKDMLVERLGLSAIRLGLALVGPVMDVLENPPEEKTEAASVHLNGSAPSEIVAPH